MFDSHCHLDFPALATCRAEVEERAVRAGVAELLVPGVDPDQWHRARAMDRGRLALRFAAGVHPRYVDEASDAALEGILAALPHVLSTLGAVALGEFGWDRRLAAGAARQDRWARAQLQRAADLDLPVILHVVGMHGRALETLEALPPPAGGVVHGYTGSRESAKRYLDLGLHLSFGPALGRSPRVAEVVAYVPRDRLLVETDAPDQSMERGGSGEPAELVAVLARVAEARGESIPSLAAATADNARRLFDRSILAPR